MLEALRPIRLVSTGAFCAWLLLTALAYQQIDWLAYAWAVNLLQYLPDWLGWLLVVVGLLAATEEARNGLLGAGDRIASLGRRLRGPARDVALLVLATAALWMLRERDFFGHADRILRLASSEHAASPAGGGSPWITWTIVRATLAIDLPAFATVQLTNCFFGAIAFVLVVRAAGALDRAGAVTIIPLVAFSAGLLRAVGGRFDAQALFVAGAALCLLLGLEALRGRVGIGITGVAFGLAAALDPLGRFLLPALAVVAWRAPAFDTPRARALGVGRALTAALAVLAAHAVLLIATAEPGDSNVVAAVLGRAPEGWVLWPGSRQKPNTVYVLASLAHLKLLANAFTLLAPAALPLLVGLGIARRGALAASPATQFLAVACASLVAGSFLIRPAAGPFDWKLYSVPALFLAFYAGALLAEIRADAVRRHVVAAVVGLQLAFFGVPLSVMAFGTTYDAGPFTERALENWAPYDPRRAPPRALLWL